MSMELFLWYALAMQTPSKVLGSYIVLWHSFAICGSFTLRAWPLFVALEYTDCTAFELALACRACILQMRAQVSRSRETCLLAAYGFLTLDGLFPEDS
ncbi:hypothetical protein B0H10DRAFT_2211376 [Mycena sp. CBHHK59/15]|nr:hypothetical protein B0H10DRAFT_2211376 [Mycena sp. CBHHK59/15]